MKQYIDLLHQGGYSCVIACSNGEVIIGKKRGVMDLYDLYSADSNILKGSRIADKVVGKGAAALMALGGVSRLHTDVISESALALLEAAGVEVSYGQRVAYIINRDRTGRCPLETLCDAESNLQQLWPIIEAFVEGMKQKIQLKTLV